MIELLPLQMEGAIVDMFESFHVFTAANVMLFLGVGAMWGRSMALGAFGGYLAFAWIAISVDVQLYTNILYVTLTLVFVGYAFKLVRLEGLGGGEA